MSSQTSSSLRRHSSVMVSGDVVPTLEVVQGARSAQLERNTPSEQHKKRDVGPAPSVGSSNSKRSSTTSRKSSASGSVDSRCTTVSQTPSTTSCATLPAWDRISVPSGVLTEADEQEAKAFERRRPTTRMVREMETAATSPYLLRAAVLTSLSAREMKEQMERVKIKILHEKELRRRAQGELKRVQEMLHNKMNTWQSAS